MKSAIAYLRVSTPNRQNGAGLDHQMTRIQAFAREAGIEIIETCRDVASGAGIDPSLRPGSGKAMTRSIELSCPIIVDGLSRFSRDTDTLERLVAEGCLHIISATAGEGASRAVIMGEAKRAQAEAERIRRTTRAGLQRARAAGQVFGNPTNLPEAQRKGSAANASKAAKHAKDLAPLIDAIQLAGKITKKAIAADLNAQGSRTSSGQRWTENNIRRPLLRIAQTAEAGSNGLTATDLNPNYGMF
ncbi:recombinase family protein [Lichenihabitans psoromatis]|uniref:recombinase family protein n=1 Tax=Lichenihabitans psoromatis TaxID=2528642 RepID=UPI0013F15D2B|nr:recombinase family protein [Lichenihabitans psoromatis]